MIVKKMYKSVYYGLSIFFGHMECVAMAVFSGMRGQKASHSLIHQQQGYSINVKSNAQLILYLHHQQNAISSMLSIRKHVSCPARKSSFIAKAYQRNLFIQLTHFSMIIKQQRRLQTVTQSTLIILFILRSISEARWVRRTDWITDYYHS